MMNLEHRSVGDVAIVVLVGDLDSRAAPDVQQELDQVMSSHDRVLLDFGRMSYLSSAGLRLLLLLYRQAERNGTEVALADVPAEVNEVLSATGFVDFFTMVDTVDDGVAVLAR